MNTFFSASRVATLACFVSVVAAFLHMQLQPVPRVVKISPPVKQETVTIPDVLSAADRLAYTRIFELQEKADWKTADRAIKLLDDSILMGHVLAQRYLHKAYVSKPEELTEWLKHYKDLPQAKQIYALALQKGSKGIAELQNPASVKISQTDSAKPIDRFGRTLINRELKGKSALQAPIRKLLISGKQQQALALLAKARGISPREYDLLRWYIAGSHFNNGYYRQAAILASASADRSGKAVPALNWLAGLSQWHQGNIRLAYRYFAAMAKAHEKLPDNDTAAAAFWAYRAAKKLGKEVLATHYLQEAARQPNTFYGIQAAHALNQRPAMNLKPRQLSRWDMDTLTRQEPVRRIIALAQLGRRSDAEQEMRALYAETDHSQQSRLIALSMMLDMPALQMRLASDLALKGIDQLDYALYPTPGWQPHNGYAVDPALIFAIARQESGFNPAARSHAGASGIMQLMPQTARYLLQKADPALKLAINKNGMQSPLSNITLGQLYLHTLQQETSVGNNLVFLIASYNAGPNTVSKWQRQIGYQKDPLLFIESIPFVETRAYVQHVLANYWIYNEIIGHENPSLKSLLAGNWPQYALSSQQLASTLDYLQQRNHSRNAL